MSREILVIPEDPTNNGYILRPLFSALLRRIGKPNARVRVLTDPRAQGFSHAVKLLEEILPDRWRHIQPWVFVPDADRANESAMRELEERSLRRGIRLITCIAQPELEIYACFARRKSLPLRWQELRQHTHFKEDVFQKLISDGGVDPRGAGGGRAQLIKESIAELESMIQLCPGLHLLSERLEPLVL